MVEEVVADVVLECVRVLETVALVVGEDLSFVAALCLGCDIAGVDT